MNKCGQSFFVSLLCLSITTFSLADDNTNVDLNPRTLHTFMSDGGYVATAPFRTGQRSFWLAMGAVGITVGASFLDRTFRDRLAPSFDTPASQNLRTFSDVMQFVGPAVGTGFLIEGSVNDNDKSKETGYLVYECFAWTAVYQGGLNYLVGRKRPIETDDPYSFEPFHIDTAFPSGHTAQAFAAATVFSEQYPHWYVEVPAYSLAAATGYSRMYSGKHWFSDVVGGAMIGMYIAHTVRTHRRRQDKKDATAWRLSTNGQNLVLSRKF